LATKDAELVAQHQEFEVLGAWGVRCVLSRRPLVFVAQAAEDLATTRLTQGRHARCLTNARRPGLAQAEAAVRTALVGVLEVAALDANKLLTAGDQQVVEALLADGPNPALGDGIGVGRPNWRADDLGTSRAPGVVERPGEPRVPVAGQEPERGGVAAEVEE
jgi:hypothetical protein